ncbi:MAG: hypothetical protein WCI20_16050 [bacterium]
MDGLNGASQAQASPYLLESEIGLFDQKKAQLAAMGVDNEGLATAPMVTGSDVTGMAALLDELFDHPERDLKTAGHLFTGGVAAIIGLENTLPKIH